MPAAVEKMNRLIGEKTPFVFIIDFDALRPIVIPVSEIDPEKLLFDFNGFRNYIPPEPNSAPVTLRKKPMPFEMYKHQFDKVKHEIQSGNTYLLNLTCSTPVEISHSLKDIFFRSLAKYKIWFDDQWTVFSPESFIRIRDGRVSTYPMKGTIDAALPDAESRILNDPKETAEHNTIVDLMRNDLSMIARNVRVSRFRYIDRITTADKTLLQVSSEISGVLPEDYAKSLGEMIFRLLPAGSISGAPKEKTVSIIRQTETHSRGYFTGICGWSDGKQLDSGVMIRFIERQNDRYTYKSGGGITFMSDPFTEYQEVIDKIYVPII